MGTGESDFHVVAIHVLATPNATSINLILCLLRFLLTVVKLPKRQSSGSNGKGASIILASVSQMSYQNCQTVLIYSIMLETCCVHHLVPYLPEGNQGQTKGSFMNAMNVNTISPDREARLWSIEIRFFSSTV